MNQLTAQTATRTTLPVIPTKIHSIAIEKMAHFLYGKSLWARGELGLTPLLESLYHNDYVAATAFLAHSESFARKVSDQHHNALHYLAVLNNRQNVEEVGTTRQLVQHLLLVGVTNAEDPSGRTAYDKALDFENIELALSLVEEGIVDVNYRSQGAWALLHVAARMGDVKTVLWALKHRATIDLRSSGTNSTALHKAAAAGNYLVLKLLLEHGANWSLKNHFGSTALDLAMDRPECRDLLMACERMTVHALLDRVAL